MLRILSEKIEKVVFVVVAFHEWQNQELLGGHPYFQNALMIFMIFRNKYGTAVTVDMHENRPFLFSDPTCNSIHSSVRWRADQHLRSGHVRTVKLWCHAITFHEQACQVSCCQCFARPRGSLDHRERLLERHLDSLLLVKVQLPGKLAHQEGYVWLVNCGDKGTEELVS